MILIRRALLQRNHQNQIIYIKTDGSLDDTNGSPDKEYLFSSQVRDGLFNGKIPKV